MAQSRKRAPRYTTDKGTAVFPHLVTPDTKFNAEGEYHTKIRLEIDSLIYDEKRKAVGTVVEVIDEKIAEAVAFYTEQNAGKKDKRGKPVEVVEADPPYEVDGDSHVLVKVKLKASGKNRQTGEDFTQKPALFDAKGSKFTPDRLWNGSIIKPAFEIVPYFAATDKKAGVTLRLKAVQVIELVTASAPGADAFGFGEEEGYESGEEEDDNEGSEFGDEADYEQEAARQAQATDAADF